jgi:hypothetical protein
VEIYTAMLMNTIHTNIGILYPPTEKVDTLSQGVNYYPLIEVESDRTVKDEENDSSSGFCLLMLYSMRPVVREVDRETPVGR